MQVEAEIEGPTHLRLKRPLQAKVGTVVTIEILDASENDDFLSGASALLNRAYGDDEPDYSEEGTPIHAS